MIGNRGYSEAPSSHIAQTKYKKPLLILDHRWDRPSYLICRLPSLLNQANQGAQSHTPRNQQQRAYDTWLQGNDQGKTHIGPFNNMMFAWFYSLAKLILPQGRNPQ